MALHYFFFDRIIGHSLGGSVAALLAILLKNAKQYNYTIQSVVTFGQPMLTDRYDDSLIFSLNLVRNTLLIVSVG